MTTTNENVASEFAASLKDVVAAVRNLVEAAASEEVEDWRQAVEAIETAAADTLEYVKRVETVPCFLDGVMPNTFVMYLADGTSLMIEVTRVA